MNELKNPYLLELDELRIGNIVLYEGKPAHVTFLSRDIDDEYEDTIGVCLLGESTNEKAHWNRELKIMPIPLSPAILEACGFVKDGFNGYSYVLYQFKDHTRELYFAGDYLYMLEKNGDQTGDREFMVIWNRDIKKQFYLHQLQNLVQAISGNPLHLTAEQLKG